MLKAVMYLMSVRQPPNPVRHICALGQCHTGDQASSCSTPSQLSSVFQFSTLSFIFKPFYIFRLCHMTYYFSP